MFHAVLITARAFRLRLELTYVSSVVRIVKRAPRAYNSQLESAV